MVDAGPEKTRRVKVVFEVQAIKWPLPAQAKGEQPFLGIVFSYLIPEGCS